MARPSKKRTARKISKVNPFTVKKVTKSSKSSKSKKNKLTVDMVNNLFIKHVEKSAGTKSSNEKPLLLPSSTQDSRCERAKDDTPVLTDEILKQTLGNLSLK